MQTVECTLCGKQIGFGDGGAQHLEPSSCQAEGMAIVAADLPGLADLIFGGPHGWAYRDIRNARRMQGSTHQVLTSIELRREGHASNWFRTGEDMTVRIGFDGVSSPQSYFGVYFVNVYAERAATLHSTHAGPLQVPKSGVIDCRVENLLLGAGQYWVMIDYGTSTGDRSFTAFLDCVPSAAKFRVKLDGYLDGIGLNSDEGVATRSQWRVT